ncbi:TIGR02587 family membrane protein [Longimicrobium sp.]|uniref:TIGR02587 family membrane protein n=1 Tax=Longimicrobium sp. TaxID=2029185 RepID=UPI003B3A5FB6
MRVEDRKFFVGLARAFGGAVLFSLPLLMTMEMWWLGFYLDRVKLLLFMVLMIPVVVALDYFSGFEETASWREDLMDGMIAYGVGLVASFVILLLFGIVNVEQPLREVVGKVAIQSVPASFGAVLANSQLAGDGDAAERRRKEDAGYAAKLFIMAAGAVFLAFNVAPTEEMIYISFIMSSWHALALVAASLLMMHGFVYASEFRGAPRVAHGTPGWSLFLRNTVVGYAIALAVSAYVLWTFGRLEHGVPSTYVMMTLVLGFPAALGAAAARLII